MNLPDNGSLANLVAAQKFIHTNTWCDKPIEYWMLGIVEEMGEMAESVINNDWKNFRQELAQITSICENLVSHIDSSKINIEKEL